MSGEVHNEIAEGIANGDMEMKYLPPDFKRIFWEQQTCIVVIGVYVCMLINAILLGTQIAASKASGKTGVRWHLCLFCGA